jgi:hypothetical protein
MKYAHEYYQAGMFILNNELKNNYDQKNNIWKRPCPFSKR